MENYTHEGLATASRGGKKFLCVTGVGDRLLRWHAIAAWASATGNHVHVPIADGLGHGSPVQQLQHVGLIDAIVVPPPCISLGSLQRCTQRFHLEEESDYGAAADYWESLPETFRTVSRNELMHHRLMAVFRPRSPIRRRTSYPYIVVHVRQGDGSFPDQDYMRPVSKLLSSLGCEELAVVSDSRKHKEKWEFYLQKDCHRMSQFEPLPGSHTVAEDYAKLWHCSGIVSVCRERWSAFPYCVAVQRAIPILFWPAPMVDTTDLPQNCRSAEDFLKLAGRRAASVGSTSHQEARPSHTDSAGRL